MIDILRFLLGEIENPRGFGREIFDFEKEDPSKDLSLEIRNGNFYMMAIDARAVTIFELELFFEKSPGPHPWRRGKNRNLPHTRF